MTKRIISAEQTEAALVAAQARNPHRERILAIRAQMADLSKALGELVSDDEKYCNLMLFLSRDFDSRTAAVSLMTNVELSSHLFNAFIEHADDEITEALLDEVIDRLGGLEDEADEPKAA